MSKVVGKDQPGDCESWVLPSFNDPNNSSGSATLTARQIEALQKQAYEEAYNEGHKQGIEQGLVAASGQIQARMNMLNSVLESLSAPFSDLDTQVDEELVILVKSLVKQMVRRELKSDPGQVMAVIREAIESLPVASRHLQLRLHPEDAALVHEFYKLGEQDNAWDVVEDPLISRGGCKVITDVSQVDATLETRLSQLFAHVFGERQQDVDE